MRDSSSGWNNAWRTFLLPLGDRMPDLPADTDLAQLSGIPRELFASDVFQNYAERLIRIAEERMRPELQVKVAPEDVVQSAFKSFFRRLHDFRLDSNSPDAVWGLLVVITIRKCAKWSDVFHAEKRALDREVAGLSSASGFDNHWELIARDPGPEEAAVLTELIAMLMSEFESRQQQIILLRMEGFGLEEIARKLHSSRRTVARVIAEAKQRMLALLDES